MADGYGFFILSTLHKSLIPIYSNYYNESKSERTGAVIVSNTKMHDFACIFLGSDLIFSNCFSTLFLHLSNIPNLF